MFCYNKEKAKAKTEIDFVFSHEGRDVVSTTFIANFRIASSLRMRSKIVSLMAFLFSC